MEYTKYTFTNNKNDKFKIRFWNKFEIIYLK